MKRSAYDVLVNQLAADKHQPEDVWFEYGDYQIHMPAGFYFEVFGRPGVKGVENYFDQICDDRLPENRDDWNVLLGYVLPQIGKSSRQMLMELPEDAVHILY